MHATCRRIYRSHIYYTMTELEGKTRGAATHTVEAPSRLTQGADSNEQAYGINARDMSQNIQKSYLLHHDRAGRENPRAATHTVEAPSRLTQGAIRMSKPMGSHTRDQEAVPQRCRRDQR
jgi:hypothetical protein